MINHSKMSYIYNSLKPHLCKDVIGMIEDMVRWEGDANLNFQGYVTMTVDRNFVNIFNKINNNKWNSDISYCPRLYAEKILKKWYMDDYKSKYVTLIKVSENCFVLYENTGHTLSAADNLKTLYDNHLFANEKERFLELHSMDDSDNFF